MNIKRTPLRILTALIACLLLAPVFSAGALALSRSDPFLYADLSRADFQFDYTPIANAEYTLYVFSRDSESVHAQAELMENGETLLQGEGSGAIFSTWLASGATYTFRVHGSGNAVIEVARQALSRCFGDALAVEDPSSNGKMIARSFDAHWYSFEASDDGPLALTCVPDDKNLYLSALIFDENGTLISTFRTLPGGSCLYFLETQAGSRYYLRVFSPNGNEGYYYLNLRRPQQGSQAVSFRSDMYELTAGGFLDLSAEIDGETALWTCSRPDLALVSQDGMLHILQPGLFEISAFGFENTASCIVEAGYVALEELSFDQDRLTLAAGDSTKLKLRFTPENASEHRVEYRVENPGVAEISGHGMLTGIAEGETTLHAFCGDCSASLRVTVTPAVPKYRALLIGEQNYPPSVNSIRTGSENSVNAIAAMLGTMENGGIAVQTACDLSKAELIAKIRTCFEKTSEQDVSLLYITCHGSYSGGMSFLELSDGSALSARDLERELRRIRGTVVVMVDCCGSGGIIGKASADSEFTKGVSDAFALPALSGSRYKVIASAGLDQDSFRIAFNENADTGVMATVFARALCDGAGWDIDRNRRSAMGADADFDGCVTAAELSEYMRARVDWYLNITSELSGTEYTQSVQAYPEGDPYILFKR